MKELSLNILDIVQNSIVAGASFVEIHVSEDTSADLMEIQIIDDGRGMTAEQLGNACDPFYTSRTGRRVGLGLPFFKMAAEMCGGEFFISSEPGVGTALKGTFAISHIDRMPLGDMCETMCLLIRCNPDMDFLYLRKRDELQFSLDTRDLRQILGDVPLDSPDVAEWIEGFLAENTQSISGKTV